MYKIQYILLASFELTFQPLLWGRFVKIQQKDICTFRPWIRVEKYFLWSKYIFLVWKAFIIISHSALPQSFCDNKFSAFWRQFHNRKGKLEGSWHIIYSCGTFPPSYRKRCSDNTNYFDFTWWLDTENFLPNRHFMWQFLRLGHTISKTKK